MGNGYSIFVVERHWFVGGSIMVIKCHHCGKFMRLDGNAEHHYQPDAWGPLPGFDYREEDWWSHKVCPKKGEAHAKNAAAIEARI